MYLIGIFSHLLTIHTAVEAEAVLLHTSHQKKHKDELRGTFTFLGECKKAIEAHSFLTNDVENVYKNHTHIERIYSLLQCIYRHRCKTPPYTSNMYKMVIL